VKPSDLVNSSGITNNNWLFEQYDCPPGVFVQLTPSNDVNQVIRDGVVIAVFNKDDHYNLHKFIKGLQ
jgi:hypothetical protein